MVDRGIGSEGALGASIEAKEVFNSLLAKKNDFGPFNKEIESYKFCAMIGLHIGRKIEVVAKTSWRAAILKEDFESLIRTLGDEVDRIDWVRAMNGYAEYGAKYLRDFFYMPERDYYDIGKALYLLGLDESDVCDTCEAIVEINSERCWHCDIELGD